MYDDKLVQEAKRDVVESLRRHLKKTHSTLRGLREELESFDLNDRSADRARGDLFFCRQSFINALDTWVQVHTKAQLAEDDTLVVKVLALSESEFDRWLNDPQ
jgi:hypothetical protein